MKEQGIRVIGKGLLGRKWCVGFQGLPSGG